MTAVLRRSRARPCRPWRVLRCGLGAALLLLGADGTRPVAAITGGRETGGDPAVVALTLTAGVFEPAACTGVLVSPRVVLTAAHCLSAAPRGLRVVFGERVDRPSMVVPALETVVHPEWNPATLENDIGMVLLEAPVTDVAPLPLRRMPANAPLEGTALRIVGFGAASPDDATTVGVKRQGTTHLSARRPTSFLDEASPQSTCDGDSGAPAFLDADGAEILMGISSRGGRGCEGFGVKTRVDAYLDDFVEPYLESVRRGGTPTGSRCVLAEQCDAGRCLQAPDDPGVRYCSARCSRDGECPAAMRCHDSWCRYPLPSPGALGSACERDADCSGRLCAAPAPGARRTCSVSCLPRALKPCAAEKSCLERAEAPGSFACMPAPAGAGG